MTTALHEARLAAVRDALAGVGARRVLDLGCGDGALLVRLAQLPWIERLVGVDSAGDRLEALRRALAAAPTVHAEVALIEASLTERVRLPTGFDAAVLVETLEHLSPDRLSAVELAVFRHCAPATVIVTTPNADFNELLGVPAHRLRHPDHRFEWGRERFARWAAGVAARHGYAAECRCLLDTHPELGGPTQTAVFRRGPFAAAV